MTDETPAGGDGAPPAKRVSGSARMKELYGTRRPGAKAKAKHKRVAWLRSARVIDLEAFARLRATGAGAKKLGRALGAQPATAQKLMAGTHWQQSPEKVAEFNRFHGASIDPATGIPTAGDLAKFAGKHDVNTRHSSAGEKDLRAIVEDAGVSPSLVTEAMRRVKMLAGEGVDLPARPDTKYFQDAIDEKLALVLACLDQVTIASASVADLTRLFNSLTEKRALMRGEPTAIVRNEQRGGLDKLGELLLGELKRRNMAPAMLDITPAKEGTNG